MTDESTNFGKVDGDVQSNWGRSNNQHSQDNRRHNDSRDQRHHYNNSQYGLFLFCLLTVFFVELFFG